MKRCSVIIFTLFVVCAGAAKAGWTWTEILSENFNSDPSANWSYSGRQNGASQDLIRWNAAGRIDAEWDQANNLDLTGDPYIIEPSRYSRSLGQTLTDTQTFKFGATLNVTSVSDTENFWQVANFGLYNLTHMGNDRAMTDNWSGNSTIIKDGSDFVEWNYFINNGAFGGAWNPMTQPTIGAHITGDSGDYTVGDSGDVYWHNTDMGEDNYLPTGVSLYVEVTYWGSATDGDRRRAYSAVYTDADRTTLLSVNGVEQYYWTVAVDDAKSFSLTDASFWNYVDMDWGSGYSSGSGFFDDFYVATGTPEPATAGLLALGSLGLLKSRRRRT
ncbi:MAG: PEP-CTERM sorting domain-containing protein [Planctomycetota bacterium]|nr:PEP-CTERM sorting domain-containing protein [Planctomycetota bacterium]